MKKSLIILGITALASSMLFAQTVRPTQPLDPRLQNIRIQRDEVGLDIQVKSMIPEGGFYKVKADTYVATGKYRFVMDDKIMRDNSEQLLNKWLKESK